MSDKRVREMASVMTNIPVEDDMEKIEKRTRFIKSKLDAMNEEQLTRFEFFYRSHFSRSQIKDILSNAINERTDKDYPINDDIAIVVSSLTKLFVGELIDTAITAKRLEDNESTTQVLTVDDIREGYICLQKENKVSKQDENFFMFSKNQFISPCSIDNLEFIDVMNNQTKGL
eukprot:gene9741-20258_t